jgi:hypothetical protein
MKCPALAAGLDGAHRAVWLVLLLLLLTGAQNSAPAGQQPIPNQMGQRPGNPFSDSTDVDPVEAQKRLRGLNAERQRSMVSDADKLLKLVTEFNAGLAGENSGQLTSTQLRQVVEIEKLAHNVKQKMALNVGPAPATPDLFSPQIR